HWRHNPGFVAAAAAGSLGLVLALGLVIHGGLRLLSGTPEDTDLPEETSTDDLGEAGGLPVAFGDPDAPLAESNSAARRAARSKARALPEQKEPDAFDDEAPAAFGSARLTANRRRGSVARQQSQDLDERAFHEDPEEEMFTPRQSTKANGK